MRKRLDNRIAYAGPWLALAIMLALTPAQATEHQSIASIRAHAVQFVKAHLQNHTGHIKVHAAGPDSRLRLARCTTPLQAFFPHGGKINTRTSVGVRCTGTKPWTIYVPVLVNRFGAVVVAAQAFRRGDVARASGLKMIKKNLDNLPFGWFHSKTRLKGQHFVRSVRPGDVITPAMLAVNNVIKRGQHVTLLAKNGGIEVRVAGKALSAAAPHELIRVQNLSSHTIVQGVVRSSHVVEVSP